MKKSYRPQKFSDVCGQDPVVKTLQNALRLGRIANAYLFAGSRGTGKTTLARIVAKALNCENLEDAEPCGTCTSCCEIASGHSLDVLEIDGASNRGIDDIRALNETVSYATAGRCKVYIIDEVHMLTKEAFNALLKTLEEPPENVRFFFATTEPHKVLPTILSRCQRFDLARIDEETIAEKLARIAAEENLAIDSDALALLARLAEGGLRDAESLLAQMACFASPITRAAIEKTLGITPKEDYLALDKAIAAYDLPFALTLSETLFASGRDLPHFLDGLAEHYRSHLHAALTGQESPFPKETLFTLLDTLLPELEKKTAFKQYHLEVILCRLIRASRTLPIDALVSRLEGLKTAPPKPPEPAKAPPVPEKAPEPIKELLETAPIPSTAREENLIRFAGVEFNGVVKK